MTLLEAHHFLQLSFAPDLEGLCLPVAHRAGALVASQQMVEARPRPRLGAGGSQANREWLQT